MVHCYKVMVLKVALDVVITYSINLGHTFYLFDTLWAIGNNHIKLENAMGHKFNLLCRSPASKPKIEW